MSASTLRTRSALVAKRGSPARGDEPSGSASSTAANRWNWPSLPTASTTSRSAAATVWYGAMLGWRVAEPAGHHAGVEICRCLVDQSGEQAGEQVDLDPLAEAGAFPVQQRGQDAGDQVLAGEHVDHGDPDLRRIAVSRTGDRHEAADRLDQEVVPGGVAAAPTEAGDARVDQRRSARGQRLVAETEALHRARPEVLDHDVGRCGELKCGRSSLRCGEIECYAALVAVHRQEVGRLTTRGGGRLPAPRLVARTRSLHLDHVRAEVPERHRGERPSEHAGEVGDDDPVQRSPASRRGSEPRVRHSLFKRHDDTTPRTVRTRGRGWRNPMRGTSMLAVAEAGATPDTDESTTAPPTVTGPGRSPAHGWRLNVLGPVELCYDGRPVDVTGATRTLLAHARPHAG